MINSCSFHSHFVAARVTLSIDAIGAAEINQAVPVEASESIPPLKVYCETGGMGVYHLPILDASIRFTKTDQTWWLLKE